MRQVLVPSPSDRRGKMGLHVGLFLLWRFGPTKYPVCFSRYKGGQCEACTFTVSWRRRLSDELPTKIW